MAAHQYQMGGGNIGIGGMQFSPQQLQQFKQQATRLGPVSVSQLSNRVVGI